MYLLSFPRFWTLSIERFWFLFWSILNGMTNGMTSQSFYQWSSIRCWQFNFRITIRWLNGTFYYLVPLGSTPELPAEICKEIKASEGEAKSKKYWLSTIKPGIPLLAYCDMKTEGKCNCIACEMIYRLRNDPQFIFLRPRNDSLFSPPPSLPAPLPLVFQSLLWWRPRSMYPLVTLSLKKKKKNYSAG